MAIITEGQGAGKKRLIEGRYKSKIMRILKEGPLSIEPISEILDLNSTATSCLLETLVILGEIKKYSFIPKNSRSKELDTLFALNQ
ncbi:MAG: hypothetical protein ACFFCS_13080 [Candidatus Hodarchaeota archaeon]